MIPNTIVTYRAHTNRAYIIGLPIFETAQLGAYNSIFTTKSCAQLQSLGWRSFYGLAVALLLVLIFPNHSR